MVEINRDKFLSKLRGLVMKKIIKEQELINYFILYFAAYLGDILEENEWEKITANNYFELIGQAISRLRQEDSEDDEDMSVLINALRGKNSMEQRIRDFFILEAVVKKIAPKNFYEELKAD
jgi:hypothetical protein